MKMIQRLRLELFVLGYGFHRVFVFFSVSGHGYALDVHPSVIWRLRRFGVGVELNPISNQVLGLVDDIRNHRNKQLMDIAYFNRPPLQFSVNSDDCLIFGTKWNTFLNNILKIFWISHFISQCPLMGSKGRPKPQLQQNFCLGELLTFPLSWKKSWWSDEVNDHNFVFFFNLHKFPPSGSLHRKNKTFFLD